jgi:hypothetical protein
MAESLTAPASLRSIQSGPFFLSRLDGEVTIDPIGCDLAEMARDEAVHTAGEILRSREKSSNGRPWRMTVADAESNVVFSLEFSSDRHGL